MSAACNPLRQRPRLLRALLCAVASLSIFGVAASVQAQEVKPAHGLAMHGDLKYPADFKHFDYVNPDAPKGGSARFFSLGTFDNLNPFILRGLPAAGLGLAYDTLMVNAGDEPFSEYGLLAQSVEAPPDRSWVIFNLRPEARFHDGTPVTADDVVFTFETILAKGHPQLRFYYASVAKVEKLDRLRVKFTFKPGDNRELPLILGQLAIIPKHYWEKRDFERATVEPPLSSGPYKIEAAEPGRAITYRRDPNYWGRNLPMNIGRFNFDTIRYDYYRDSTVALEAFRAGQYDLREENSAKNWATEYDFPAVRRGLVTKTEIETHTPSGMQGFVFNTRRPIFADRRVREALNYAFDFEWSNRNLFYGAYTRTESYFDNSELAAKGLPEGEELKILERYRGRVPDEVFTTPYHAPKTDGSGNARGNLLKALRLLESAGWRVRPSDGVMLDTEGRPVSFEVLLISPQFERIVSPFARNLKRLGIEASIRTVDTSQYQNRTDQWDFDMIVGSWGQSLSPGNEQRDFWSSQAAETPGSRNLAGIKDPVIDELVDMVIAAPDRESLVARTRALDRVLLWGYYVIPQFYVGADRIAYWNKFSRPEKTPLQGYQADTWWIEQSREAVVATAKQQAAAEATTEQTKAPSDEPAGRLWLYLTAAAAVCLLIYALWRARKRRE